MLRDRCSLPVVLLASGLWLAGCADSSSSGSSGGSSGGFVLDPFAANLEGSNGCFGVNLTFPQTPEAIPLTSIVITSASRLAASATEEKLYITGVESGFFGNAFVAEVDLTTGTPVESAYVTPGDIQTTLVGGGVAGAAQLAGIALIAPGVVIFMDQTSNSVLGFDPVSGLFVFAGELNTEGGYSDPTLAEDSRFDFSEPGDLCPTGDGRVLIADTGNNRIRMFRDSEVGSVVVTLAGTGDAGSVDGNFDDTTFDSPWGLTVGCTGQVLITESGAVTGAGNRLRGVMLGAGTSFAALDIDAYTLVGDGTLATVEGPGGLAGLARPSPPVATADGEVYWVDTATGVLRRYDLAGGVADCPGFVDCASAVAAPLFSPSGGNFSLAIGASGDLYVLESDTQTLWRIPAP
ncbi:MAG: hypothetical protein AAF682_27065 [Planctomycetota bacterium]